MAFVFLELVSAGKANIQFPPKILNLTIGKAGVESTVNKWMTMRSNVFLTVLARVPSSPRLVSVSVITASLVLTAVLVRNYLL